MQNDRYVTISSVTRYIKRVFEEDDNLNNVWVRGELSNVKRHSRGHLYFTLKDEHSKVNAVMFSGNNRFLSFQPEEGMKVLIQGEISVYEPQGQYQLYARTMKKDGVGNLFLAYEELKRKLESEGLFDSSRKKKVPSFPDEIGVITSPTGAAVRDIITTIRRRFPIAKVTVYPVLVQGSGAAASIAKAIEKANRGPSHVLIIGRGGGSIEELWAFNEELVARAIYGSTIPVISAVGHETDFTIADFVADLRAPTPTAAAELAVPHIAELHDRLAQRHFRLTRAVGDQIAQYRQRLSRLQKSYAFRYPDQLIKQKEVELDRVLEMMTREMNRNIERQKSKIRQMQKQLSYFSPGDQILKMKEKQLKLGKSLIRSMQQQVKGSQSGFQSKLSRLNALNPLAVMERGYSLVYREDEQLVKSVKQIQPGDTIKVRLQDGKLDCQVWGLEEKNNG
ncbi:exodeoxyribonuclease VII large subunit [Fictibacillus terranigra]|uniref:Exodeoxyribonuclease 7 large subunit n=1 Tax=Fictibacillus terranigra TaxID=3058424 RepID=A0ABT8E9Y1_9BACL|nr:exodeoxyribonuclease VII large subunit [Fictibacillus sp. CENA-BCM004]MDN4074697.1 exodeoxyribonuclease VII large subunit [Fictibacillus sp. CENA-BCM004]